MFVDLNPDSEKIIYSHFTCATGNYFESCLLVVSLNHKLLLWGWQEQDAQRFLRILCSPSVCTKLTCSINLSRIFVLNSKLSLFTFNLKFVYNFVEVLIIADKKNVKCQSMRLTRSKIKTRASCLAT